jgi:protein-L-isoaspartate(D-aspartate) O-methyltransferase
VGPDGRVVTLDVDADLADLARDNLARAGVEGVDVVHADGYAGWPPGAPYDRVIVTAGVDDLSPAWADQLVEVGLVVLPLGLAMPAQHCVALARRGPVLVSTELCPCAFMPLRGDMAPELRALDDRLRGWLALGGRATGYAVPVGDIRAGFATWLALTRDGYVATGFGGDQPPGLGLRDEHGVALVSDQGEDGRHPVLLFGGGEAVAARLIEAHRAWVRERPGYDRLRITAQPTGQTPIPERHVHIVRRPRFTFVVSTA